MNQIRAAPTITPMTVGQIAETRRIARVFVAVLTVHGGLLSLRSSQRLRHP